MRTVIIPSAGKATRFGGLLKELLPLNATDTPLKRAIDNAVIGMDADEVVIITNKNKLWEHINYISCNIPFHLPIQYVPQVYDRDLLGAILTGISPYTDGGLVLPDTVTMVNAHNITAPLSFGTFLTLEPNRFSVLADKTIYTKQASMPVKNENPLGYKAWGAVMWSKEVAEYWIEHSDKYEHYDDMFRDAMNRWGYATFDLPYYYDLGSFESYLQYLKDTHR
jgi:hypothetical protein